MTAPQSNSAGTRALRMRYPIVFLFSILLTVPGIWMLPPLDRDEARFVQATKQMLESGDYIDIRFQDEPRYKKPVGIYWLQAAAGQASGFDGAAPIWIYRLVSVLGAAAAALAVAWTGSRLFGPMAGLVSGIIFAAIVATAFEGRIAKTDAVLLALATLAQGALAQIHFGARRGQPVAGHLPWLFWAAQGFAVLIKGPIAPLLSGLTVLALWAWERDLRWLAKLRPGPGFALAGLIVMPWLVLISWKSGGAFWQEALGRDLMGKVAGGQESHGAPPGYFALTYGLYFWPFGLLALGAGLRALERWRSDPRLTFCIAWYVPFWLVLELVPTKLPHYVIPAYPALALLAGWLATLPQDEANGPFRGWMKWLRRFTAAGLFAVTVALAAGALGLPLYLNGNLSYWGIGGALAVLVTGAAAITRQVRLPAGRIAATAIAAAASYAIMFGAVLPLLSPVWLSPRIASAVAIHRPCGDSVLAAVGYHEPSLVFLVGTRTLLTELESAARHIADDPGCALALIPAQKKDPFRALLEEKGLSSKILDSIEGVNYSNGRRLSLQLHQAVD